MTEKLAGRRRVAPGGELVLAGGARPKKRKAAKRDWTRAKEEAFVAALAETSNVTAAAAAAGVSVSAVYRRRRSNARFRASWAEALATAYQQLELVMLDRALNGTEKIVVRRDGSQERMREYPNAVAITLLKMHRDSAAEAASEPAEQDIEDVRERLFQKLQRLRKRIETEEQGRK